MISATEALDRLREGNRRFISGDSECALQTGRTRREELVSEQRPFAVVLGCSDSRVPVEIIFAQGLGDLFVVRVAGNVAGPSQIGSIEYAAEQLGTRLIVVLGHSSCGAVAATLEQIKSPARGLSPDLQSIVDRIRPSVEGLSPTDLRHNPEKTMQLAVRANIRASAHNLRQESKTIGRLIEDDGLLVVGAEYSLETGEVDWFDGLP